MPVRSLDNIEQIGQRIAVEAMDMLNDPSIYPTVTPINCNGCPFFGPCETRQRGGDWMYQLKSEFWERES
jgi:hypothetical protein